jgi:hypothetical protein
MLGQVAIHCIATFESQLILEVERLDKDEAVSGRVRCEGGAEPTASKTSQLGKYPCVCLHAIKICRNCLSGCSVNWILATALPWGSPSGKALCVPFGEPCPLGKERKIKLSPCISGATIQFKLQLLHQKLKDRISSGTKRKAHAPVRFPTLYYCEGVATRREGARVDIVEYDILHSQSDGGDGGLDFAGVS